MILRKEYVKQAAGAAGAPQFDASGRLIPQPAVYDVLCDAITDLVPDTTLAVGSMAYVRGASGHRYVKTADTGEAADWEALDTNENDAAPDDSQQEAET